MALVTSGHTPEDCVQTLTCGGREEGRGDPALINMKRNLAVFMGLGTGTGAHPLTRTTHCMRPLELCNSQAVKFGFLLIFSSNFQRTLLILIHSPDAYATPLN